MTRAENPPAFPFPYNDSGNFGSRPHTGMSLRDWFAGQALASIMQDRAIWDATESERESIAARMYQWADAFLAARGDGQ